MKRIVICADGTWNRPERNLAEDQPTNVLRLARAIRPSGSTGTAQQVFYDWGIGSYYDPFVGGVTGRGINKNIMDGYRYLVQNYAPGDQIFLFGFSRGAYTVRGLWGLINNCGILKRDQPHLRGLESQAHPGGIRSLQTTRQRPSSRRPALPGVSSGACAPQPQDPLRRRLGHRRCAGHSVLLPGDARS